MRCWASCWLHSAAQAGQGAGQVVGRGIYEAVSYAGSGRARVRWGWRGGRAVWLHADVCAHEYVCCRDGKYVIIGAMGIRFFSA